MEIKVYYLTPFQIKLLICKIGAIIDIERISDADLLQDYFPISELLKLYNYRLYNYPTVYNTFYRPGYCFQKKYREYWRLGFEYRYARKTSVKAFLYSSMRLGLEHNIHINSDVSLHILSFLLPKDIGKEIKVEKNSNIKKYIGNKFNYCLVGHTHIGPINCVKCQYLRYQYEKILFNIQLNTFVSSLFMEENEYYSNYTNLNNDRLQMNLNVIKHDVKYERLNIRKSNRIINFHNC